jgi:hypothetical protein
MERHTSELVTVTELVRNFASACRAIIPNLERVRVPWRDAEQYDNWDRVAEPLFSTLVVEPCMFQAIRERDLGGLRPARYGFPLALNCNAWIEVQDVSPFPMLDLASVEEPFDHVRCGQIDRLVPLAIARCSFVYLLRGNRCRLEAVDLHAD